MNLVPAFASEEPSSTGRKIFLLFKKKNKKATLSVQPQSPSALGSCPETWAELCGRGHRKSGAFSSSFLAFFGGGFAMVWG